MKSTVASKMVHKINILVYLRVKAKNSPLTFILTFLTLCLILNTFIASDWTKFSITSVSSSLLRLETEKNVDKIVQEAVNCQDRPLIPKIQQRGNYWVFYNYILPNKVHRCSESITYTTHGDYTFLDNVEPLLERWGGPVSIALHAPGYDFKPTLDSIAYLRNCGSSLIKEYVTFHLIFDALHIPKDSSSKPFSKPLTKMYVDKYNCSLDPPFKNKNYTVLYKNSKNITYPINVARNVAREMAQTHFILASDIELYPTPNFIRKFLKMISKRMELFIDNIPKVFVLPVFEILKSESVPENKAKLREMVNSHKAFLFHKRLCSRCHSISNITDWLELNDTDNGLDVFISVKRRSLWEPFYVGTRQDPLFDERLSWEGQNNKMTQAYTMCLLNYDFNVLDNAFLVHKPGVKRIKLQLQLYSETVKKTTRLTRYIKNELRILYGSRPGCL